MHNYYETIMQTAEEGENSSPRYTNVCERITKIHCSRPIGCIEKKNGMLVVLGNAVFCYIEVEDEFYRISTTYYKEWVHMSKILWNIEGDTANCCVDMPDECIGEVERLAHYVEKEFFLEDKENIYVLQLKGSGLDVEDAFKGDPRNKFKSFFEPLIEGTDYYFEDSKDGTILDLKKVGEGSRVLGFQARVAGKNKGMMYTFYDRYVYEMLNKKIGLPPNQKKDDRKKQPHVYIPLEKLWNCVCVLTRKNDKMV